MKRGAAAWLAGAALALGCAAPAPSLLEGSTISPRGHQELVLEPGRPALPLVLGSATTFGLCIETTPTTDTSRWEVELWQAGAPRPPRSPRGEPRPPDLRSGATLCFETRPVPLRGGDESLCGRLRDAYDGRSIELPCLPFRYAQDDAPLAELKATMAAILRSDSDTAEQIQALDALGARARASGFPLFELRLRLVAAYKLRRSGAAEDLAAAERRLAQAPDWLDEPAAIAWAAHVAYERATLALSSRGRLEAAWRQLRIAEEAYRRVADAKLVTVIMKQSEILARVGTPVEARERLHAAIQSCTEIPCEPALVPAARNTLAFVVLEDPDATAAELAEAERILDQVVESSSAAMDPVERANVRINLAYAHARRGADPRPALREGRRLLAESAGSLSGWLDAWSRLIEAEHELERGRPREAFEICESVAATTSAPRVAALALGCTARAGRQLGELDDAADRMERVLFLHQHADAEPLGQAIALGPGRRADDFYGAARIAIERGRADEAWRILRELDDLSVRSGDPGVCEAEGDELEQLLVELVALDAPASRDRRLQRESIQRSLKLRLQEAVRSDRCSGEAPAAADDRSVDYRACALEDEVLLLRRTPTGELRLYRRTRLSRREIAERTRAVAAWLERGTDGSVADWLALVGPLAEALVPDRRDLGPRTTFALHGILQDVPLGALPLSAVPQRPVWLTDATVVIHHLAGATPHLDPPTDGRVAPLFVVDPSENLAAASGMSGVYRAAFPAASILSGRAAEAAAVREALGSATLLHVDAHVRYDPAFPELTELVLADSPLLARQLAASAPRLHLANLSACRSGSWPVTADSGRFGLAGLLARSGVPWVIGTRSDVPDALAGDFNRAFYRELSRGSDVPEAFRAGIRSVRADHSPASWASILLLSAESASPGGIEPLADSRRGGASVRGGRDIATRGER